MAPARDRDEQAGAIAVECIFCVLFFFVSVVTAVQGLRLALAAKRVSFQILFHCLLFVVTGWRTAYFLCLAVEGGAISSQTVDDVLVFIPGVLFFLLFLSLLYFWATVAYQSVGLSIPYPKVLWTVFVLIVGGIFSFVIVAIVVDAVIEFHVWVIVEYMSALFNFLVAVVFVVYGTFMQLILRKYHVEKVVRKVRRKIAVITVVCAFAFTVRCVFILAFTLLFSARSHRDHFIQYVLVTPFYFFGCEIVPICLLLYALHSGRKVHSTARPRVFVEREEEEPLLTDNSALFYPYSMEDEDDDADENLAFGVIE